MQANTAEQTQSDLYASKYQEALWTDAARKKPLHFAAQEGHDIATEKPIAARCNVDLQKENGATYFVPPQLPSHSLASLS